MDIKTIGIGAAAGAALASATIFVIQAALKSEHRKGEQAGMLHVLNDQAIADQAVKEYKKSRILFAKKGS